MPLVIDPETFDFDLPDHLIAQSPTKDRTSAKMMVLKRAGETIDHRTFKDLPSYFSPGDILVLNETRVVPAKIVGKKPTGGRVELIFEGSAPVGGQRKALIRPAVKPGTQIILTDQVTLTVKERTDRGDYLLTGGGSELDSLLEQKGQIPLPPYIKREEGDRRSEADKEDYQTVYSKIPGSIAAPTAGLHFDDALLAELEKKGVLVEKIILHVGWGTFKPILGKAKDHQMLGERFFVSAKTLEVLNNAKKGNKKIIGVGTTVTRALESIPLGEKGPAQGETSLYIQPGFQFQWLTGLITNFHVPRSTPLSLAAAFCSLPFLEKSYNEAIQNNYRFYSYGDGMLIL